MRNILLIMIVGFAAYGGFTWWTKSRDSVNPAGEGASVSAVHSSDLKKETITPEAMSEPAPGALNVATQPLPASPTETAKRLAPTGVYYVVQGFSITTDEGVKGVRPGTKVTLIKDGGASLRVSDGPQEFDVRRELLTNDLDLAAKVSFVQNAHQTALADTTTKQDQSVAATREQNNRDAQAGIETGQRNAALQTLLLREGYLNAEATRIQSLITEYQTSANHLRTKQIFVNSRIAGDTHLSEIAALHKQLAAVRTELSSIATKKFGLKQ